MREYVSDREEKKEREEVDWGNEKKSEIKSK